jgi:hypothetical protein
VDGYRAHHGGIDRICTHRPQSRAESGIALENNSPEVEFREG